MRKRKKRLIKIKNFILILLIIYCLLFLFRIDIINKYKNLNGESVNSLYQGIGKRKVKNKEEYDTIFIASDKKEYKEYKQTNYLWANNSYWGGTMEENGCGITSISIIASGYGFDVTPEDLRKKYYPHLEGEEISKVLKSDFNIENTDFLYATAYFDENYIIGHLQKNLPILICLWNKPNNKWTDKSHYMVILATDGNDKIYISNPNGDKNKNNSGWYNIREIIPYIAKILYING